MPENGQGNPASDTVRHRLRVVVILPALSDRASGGYKVAYTYANYLAMRGHRVTIVHAMHLTGDRVRRRPWRAKVLRSLREVQRAGELFDYHVRRGHARPSWFTLDERVTVRNVAYLFARTTPRADVVVATAVTSARVTADACRRTGATGIYLIQHYEDWLADPEVVDATWRLPLTNFVIADWLANKGAELGVDSVLVPNGIDLLAFPPGPPVADRTHDVVALASDVPNKRTDVLVLALQRVAVLRGGLSAVVFGTCAPPDGLPEGVDYIRSPSPERLSELYQSAMVYLCTSDGEGWHLPPAEAMSSATAVVSTDIGGVMTYARGVCATAPAGDAGELAAQVVRLLDDPAGASSSPPRALSESATTTKRARPVASRRRSWRLGGAITLRAGESPMLERAPG